MLISMVLNYNIVDLENPNEIWSLTFIIDKFSRLFLHPSLVSIIHSRSGQKLNDTLSNF